MSVSASASVVADLPFWEYRQQSCRFGYLLLWLCSFEEVMTKGYRGILSLL